MGSTLLPILLSTSGARVMCAHLRQSKNMGTIFFAIWRISQCLRKSKRRTYFELFDVSKKSVIATLPLDQIKHMPRTGERIFLPLHEPEDWVAFKIVDIEYFLRTKEGPLEVPGMLRVTVYVEESK